MTIVFEVTLEARDAGARSDREEEENLVELILDGLGFPETVQVSAKVLRRIPIGGSQ